MRSSDFLDGVVERLRVELPAEWAGFQMRSQAHQVKLWYQEPRLHYEVWPVGGRSMLEVGLHFEADPATNHQLVQRFDPHIVWLKATLDGAVELEQWTASWGHLFHVFPAPRLDSALQATVVAWLGRLIPVAEPLLQAALSDLGPVAPPAPPARPWRFQRSGARARHG
jgi:hypothetical protein